MKRFPRKTRSTEANQEESKGSSPKSMTGKNSKLKGKRARSNGHRGNQSPLPPDANGVTQGGSPNSDKGAAEEAKTLGRRDRKDIGDELQLCDTDLENVKFKLSPSEAMLYLQSASTTVPQLFKYDSMDGIHAKSAVQVHRDNSTASEEGNLSQSSVCAPAVEQSGRHTLADGNDPRGCREGVVLKVRQGSDDEPGGKAALAKRLHLDKEGVVHLAQYRSSQLPPNGGSLSTPPLTPIALSHPHSEPPSRHHSPSCLHSQPPSHHSPDSMIVGNDVCYASPYVTPHGTPTHTPIQSPLSSPTLLSHPPNYHLHPASSSAQQGGMAINGERWPPITQPPLDFLTSPPTSMSHFNMSGVPSQLHLQPPPAASPGIGATPLFIHSVLHMTHLF